MESHNVNIGVVRCTLKLNNPGKERELLDNPLLRALNLKKIVQIAISLTKIEGDVFFEEIVIDIGVISSVDFDVQFNQKIIQLLMEALTDVSSNKNKRTILQTVDTAVFSQALLCLQPLAIRKPEEPGPLLQRLMAGVNAGYLPAGFPSARRTTDGRLALVALCYLLSNEQGRGWLNEHYPDMNLFRLVERGIFSGDISGHQILALLDTENLLCPFAQKVNIVHRWLLPLWQKTAVRNAIAQAAGKVRRLNVEKDYQRILKALLRDRKIEGASCSLPLQPVSNAGLTLVWPLLPQLFSALGLYQEERFIDDEARWRAVISLDWLVWSQPEPVSERLAVNQLLCGIAPDVLLPEQIALTAEQQQQINAWLTAICQQLQLPGGHKPGINDIRALFLQRPGEINSETLPPQIRVQPEPFDYLLGDLPWPLTLVSLPWLEQPLTLIWPLPHLTG